MEHTNYYLMRALSNWAPAEIVPQQVAPVPGSLQKLVDVLPEASRFEVISFDLFDTLIRRDVEPSEVPKRATMRLVDDALARFGVELSLDTLLEKRDIAEHIARQRNAWNSEDPECSLAEVFERLYEIFRSELGIALESTLPISELVAAEVRFEGDRLSLMPGARETLGALKELGKKVILISDMYLDKTDIEGYLQRLGIQPYVDGLFVSSQMRLSKSSGRIYQRLLADGVLRHGRTLHVGDNPIADIKRAVDNGLEARLFQPKEELERRCLLGAARRTAVSLGDLTVLEQALAQEAGVAPQSEDSLPYRLGYQHLGPAFFLYALSLFQRARRGNFRDVYFLARDGYIFREIYERIRDKTCSTKHVHAPPSRYVHIRRSMAKFASLHNLRTDILARINPTNRRWGLEQLLQSFGLETAPYHEFLEHAQGSDDVTGDALAELLKSKTFLELLSADHLKQKKVFRDYLAQENFLCGGRVLVADVGWNGTIVDSLEQAFGALPEFPQMDVAFFGLERPKYRRTENAKYVEGFAYDFLRQNPVEAIVYQAREALEFFLAPPDGPVVGYQASGQQRVRPIFGAPERDEAANRLVEDVQRGVLACCDRMLALRDRFAYDGDEFRADAIIRVAGVVTGRLPELRELFEGIELSLGWGKNNRVRLKDMLSFSTATPSSGVVPVVSEALRLRIEVDSQMGGVDAQRVVERLLTAVERLRSEEQLVIYGVGTVTSLLAPSVIDRVEFFVDNNKGLQGRTFMGKPILGLESLAKAGGKTVFVTPIKRKSVIEPVLAPYGLKTLFIDDIL